MLAEITDALRRGDVATALATARSFVAAEPANPAALQILGVALRQAGDLAGARAAFEQTLAVAPDRAEVYFSLANLQLGEGDTEGAVRRLREAVALDPNQLGAYVMLVHLALARGDLADAQDNLRLAQRVQEAHPQVRLAEGHVLQAAGDPDGALKAFTAAVTAAPEMAAAQLALGNAYLARGLWPFAEQALVNALGLDRSRPAGTLRALAEARRRQGKGKETVEVLDELIAAVPEDLTARALRAEILTTLGRAGDALADQRFLLDRHPDHPRTVLMASLQLARSGRADEALQVAEAALAKSPRTDELWRARLGLATALREDPGPVLERWLAADPENAVVLDMLAGYHQALGDAAQALAFADRALARNPGMKASFTVKLLAELRDDPASGLARVEELLPKVTDPQERRALLGWAGGALDAMGRHDAAAARWLEMLREPAPLLVPPALLDADAAPAGEGAGTLLYSPPGLRADFALRALARMLGARLRLDRAGDGPDDGFGRIRFPADHPQAGSAARWRAGVEAAGLDPATVIDWLPVVDAYTLQALQGARVVALLADPRDLLLNWMVHGSLHDFLFSADPVRSAEWLAGNLGALADHRDLHPGAVHVVRMDRDAGKAESAIETLLGLPEPLKALFGPGPGFPGGHWKHYRDRFADAFAVLAPVAARLGYPD